MIRIEYPDGTVRQEDDRLFFLLQDTCGALSLARRSFTEPSGMNTHVILGPDALTRPARTC